MWCLPNLCTSFYLYWSCNYPKTVTQYCLQHSFTCYIIGVLFCILLKLAFLLSIVFVEFIRASRCNPCVFISTCWFIVFHCMSMFRLFPFFLLLTLYSCCRKTFINVFHLCKSFSGATHRHEIAGYTCLELFQILPNCSQEYLYQFTGRGWDFLSIQV